MKLAIFYILYIHVRLSKKDIKMLNGQNIMNKFGMDCGLGNLLGLTGRSCLGYGMNGLSDVFSMFSGFGFGNYSGYRGYSGYGNYGLSSIGSLLGGTYGNTYGNSYGNDFRFNASGLYTNTRTSNNYGSRYGSTTYNNYYNGYGSHSPLTDCYGNTNWDVAAGIGMADFALGFLGNAFRTGINALSFKAQMNLAVKNIDQQIEKIVEKSGESSVEDVMNFDPENCAELTAYTNAQTAYNNNEAVINAFTAEDADFISQYQNWELELDNLKIQLVSNPGDTMLQQNIAALEKNINDKKLDYTKAIDRRDDAEVAEGKQATLKAAMQEAEAIYGAKTFKMKDAQDALAILLEQQGSDEYKAIKEAHDDSVLEKANGNVFTRNNNIAVQVKDGNIEIVNADGVENLTEADIRGLINRFFREDESENGKLYYAKAIVEQIGEDRVRALNNATLNKAYDILKRYVQENQEA